MLNTQQVLTGQTVYGGTTYAPNQGAVSAMGAQGYIKRELRHRNRNGVVRRIGGDGQSDNRSALAAKALQRARNFELTGGRPTTNGTTPGTKPGTGESPYGSGSKPGQPVGTPAPMGPPQIEVSADGILQLPYDQSWSTEQLAAITDANQKLLDLKTQNDQHALQYASERRNTDLAYNKLKKQTLSGNAAGGTAFSSKYGTDVATNATDYANQLGDLEYENASFEQNRTLQSNAIQSSLNQQLAALAQEYADSLNDQAGELGYGTGTTTVKGNPGPVKHTGHLGLGNLGGRNGKGKKKKHHPKPKPHGGTKPGR